jgi:hypothetical protein
MAKGKSYGDTAKIPQSDFSVRAEREVLRNSDKSTYQIKKGK